MIKLLGRYKAVLFPLAIILIIFFTYNVNHIASSSSENNSVVKVLIFNGNGVMSTSVDGIEDCLNDSNAMNMNGNIRFEYNTTTVINSNTLAGYNVLIMPGGDDAADYLDNSNIDSAAIKQFVESGNGYMGICAGAYAGSNYVSGYYPGWGLAPDVNTESVNYEGLLTISTTQFGADVFDKSTISVFHDNGPAMYTNNSNVIMATYADNNTGYENYAAVIGDTYGNGRVLLSGSHPELAPQNPEYLTKMILWVTKRI